MSKNNKKAPSLATLIPLGQKNKPRTATTSQSIAKKIKVEDFNPSTVISTIEQSIKQDNGTSETLLINFFNSVKSTLITSSKNGKILPSQCLALFSICKQFPTLFAKTAVVDCMCGILGYNRKESTNICSSNFTQKLVQSHSVTAAKLKQLHIAICGMLLASFKDSQKWPIQLVKAYLDDSFAERVWVDLPECNLLVRNIETAFPAPAIDPRIYFPLSSVSEQLAEINDTSDPAANISDLAEIAEVNVIETINKAISALASDDLVKPRYEHSRLSVDAMIAGYIKDNVERKYIPESQIKNIIRAFCSLAGLPEMRGAVVTKLDNWLLGKLQTVTLNMLTIMASSCNQNIVQNSHDIVFCVYLMIKFKYKTSKLPVQVALLDCIKRISEMHPNNLRNMLHIFVNNEIYNSPTVTHGATINQATPIPTSSTTHLITNKAISVTFPAIYFRFPVECIKILGDLLHEQMCIHFNDIKPVKHFIRDLCRWIKFAHSNPGGVYNAFTATGALPDCLELLDLAQSLLTERNATESLSSKMGNPLFKQAYVDNIINVLCELQMLSIIRPSVREIFKEKSDHEKRDLESIRHHYTTLRQIRYLACKWLKTIFRLVESQISNERMTFYLKQVMFLNVARSNDQSYVIDDSYAINDVLANETDKTTLIKGLTEIPLSEKLIQTMISLGFEKHLCYRPSEIVEMLSELIIRASACASTDIMPMNVTKGETVINNMFACCSYDVDLEENDPKAHVAKTLAYKTSFWKVCQALVIMACYCTDSCGAFLWANYPTIKNLMKIVITNNFENNNVDDEALETEKLHCETDAAKIIELECGLYGDGVDDSVMVDSSSSKLVNILMLNLPQGPTRQPPADVLASLRSINSFMKIGDRLSQCRSPDFLLEIVKGQDQTKVANRKWIIDLVKKTSEHNLECLPLLCLTEFIYHDLADKVNSKLPMTSSAINDTFKRLVHQIRQVLTGTKSDNADSLSRIVGAFSNSFFNRLSDASASTRNIARECLFILFQPLGSAIACMTDIGQFMVTLKSLINVKLFQENTIICSIVESLKETLKFETDIDVLRCYIELFASMSAGCYREWLVGVVDTISVLVLQRPLIIEKLKSMDHDEMKLKSIDHDEMKNVTLVSDLLAEIFLTYISYSQQAPAIGIEHQDSVVMVTWKDKKFPMSVRVIRCQLAFLSWGIVKSASCKRLAELWFIKSTKTYELPQFGEDSVERDSIVPQWLVDTAVHSGCVQTLTAIMNFHVKNNRRISHSVTPALLFMAVEFVTTYLKIMNGVLKEEKTLMEEWIGGMSDAAKGSLLKTVERLYGKVKRVASAFLDFVTHHCTSVNLRRVEAASFEPIVIVQPLAKKSEDGSGDAAMEVEEGEESNLWSGVIQGMTNGGVGGAISRLLTDRDMGIKCIIGDLIKLLKDPKTHSETLKVLNKSDVKLLPLLKLTFRSTDRESYNFCIESFNYLFNSYPHIEKLSVWKMAYNLCLVQGSQFAECKMEEEDVLAVSAVRQSHSTMVTSLVTDIMEDRHVVGCGAKIDQLTVLGLGNSSVTDDASLEAIHRLLFSSHSLHQYSAYFMSDLLHQSNVDTLRCILHSLLKKRALSNLNASRALDFIDACVNHPRLQFPGQLDSSKRHLWPQQNVPLAITEAELGSLLTLVVHECDHLVQHYGLNSTQVNRVLGARCQLIEISSAHPSMIRDRARIVQQFLDSRTHCAAAVEKLTFALYSRLPCLLLRDRDGGPLLTDRDGGPHDVFFSNVDCFSTESLQTVGKRLLWGLASGRQEVQEMAAQASKALVSRHRKLAVQLLPSVRALSDGALDGMEDWASFKRKRGNVLYSCLLQLMEIMAPYSLARDLRVRSAVTATLANFVRLLIRYRDQAAVFGPFVTRLVAFVERMVNEDLAATTATATANVNDVSFVETFAAEMSALSKVYPQFTTLVGLGHRQTASGRSQPLASGGGECPPRVALVAQLDCLAAFRAELAKAQCGAGVAQSFKNLLAGGEATVCGALCLEDLRRALASPTDEVRQAARQCVARSLAQWPEQAPRLVRECLAPALMVGSHYWSRPCAGVLLALAGLRHTAMLAPDLAVACLARYGRLFVAGNNGRGSFREAVTLVEEVLDNVSLESFIDGDDLPGLGASATVAIGTGAMPSHKRQYQQQSGDHEAHKVKRMRFK